MDDPSPGTLREDSGKIGIGDIESDTDRYRFSVPETVVRELLEFVGGPVAKIERPGGAGLERIAAADVLQVQLGAAIDQMLHGAAIALPQGGRTLFYPFEEYAVLD